MLAYWAMEARTRAIGRYSLVTALLGGEMVIRDSARSQTLTRRLHALVTVTVLVSPESTSSRVRVMMLVTGADRRIIATRPVTGSDTIELGTLSESQPCPSEVLSKPQVRLRPSGCQAEPNCQLVGEVPVRNLILSD